MAEDSKLRDITFWLLGSLGGATWHKAAIVLPFLIATAAGMPLIARGLDLLALGESEAFHMGVAVDGLKRLTIVLVAAAVVCLRGRPDLEIEMRAIRRRGAVAVSARQEAQRALLDLPAHP